MGGGAGPDESPQLLGLIDWREAGWIVRKRPLLHAWSGFLAGEGVAGTFGAFMTARRKFLVVTVGVAGALSLLSVADAKGFRRYLALRQDVDAVHARNRSLAEQNEALRQEINALRQDPAALERAVREELGYVKPGEMVFHLESP